MSFKQTVNGTGDPGLSIGPREAWCIVGSNRSGISAFFDRVALQEITVWGEDLKAEQVGFVSFKKQQEIYEDELLKDETDILDRIDPGTPARSFLGDNPGPWDGLIAAFSMTPHLDKGYRQLSTGQARKLMILARITQGCRAIVVEAPYEGLDRESRQVLDQALAQLQNNGILLLMCVYDVKDIPGFCTHVGVMQQNRFVFSGGRQAAMAFISAAFQRDKADFKASAGDLRGNCPGVPVPGGSKKELVRLHLGSAGYNGKRVFQDVDLFIRQGDHTLVTGPNGCGKSTLLQVICGDHPGCYTNDLKIFGRQRGTGESVWDIKRRMGIVSSDLHRNWRVPGSALHCVVSGFFDSIGLYRPCSERQERQAMEWLDRIGLAASRNVPFRQLAYADQRLVLIARALIKVPDLLVLDEPTQGLDGANREALLDFLADVGKENLSTILYVSHREDEFRPFFVQHLKMG